MSIEFLSVEQAIARSVPSPDVYQHPAYGWSAERIDRGTWECAYDETRGISFPFIRRNIANGADYDTLTPYGYGGLSCSLGVSESDKRQFRREYLRVAKERGLVAELLRLNPLDRHGILLESSDQRSAHTTFGSRVVCPQEEFAATSGKHRTAVRKSRKLGVEVQQLETSTLRDPKSPFRQIYDATMRRVDARDSLRLDSSYYERLLTVPSGVGLLGAVQHDQVIAAAIFMSWGDRLHYHLSGATEEGRTAQATSALIAYAVAELAQPPFTLHLGGGVEPDDPLTKFKRANSSTEFTMHTARCITNPIRYRALTRDLPSTDYFPAYRNPELLS